MWAPHSFVFSAKCLWSWTEAWWPGDRGGDFADAVFPCVTFQPHYLQDLKSAEIPSKFTSWATKTARAPFWKSGFE